MFFFRLSHHSFIRVHRGLCTLWNWLQCTNMLLFLMLQTLLFSAYILAAAVAFVVVAKLRAHWFNAPKWKIRGKKNENIKIVRDCVYKMHVTAWVMSNYTYTIPTQCLLSRHVALFQPFIFILARRSETFFSLFIFFEIHSALEATQNNSSNINA